MNMADGWFVPRKVCPVCSSEKFSEVYSCKYSQEPLKGYIYDFYIPQGQVEFEYLEGADYTLCECLDCGLIFQKNIPGDKLMERLYEHWINPHKALQRKEIEAGVERFTNFALEISQVIELFGKKPSQLSFFDFGMGWGRWALMAKALGCSSAGLELSRARAEYARENGINVISRDEIPGSDFDFINADQVFEHIPVPLQTLVYLKRGLKASGIIKISVPDAQDVERRLSIMDWKASKKSSNSLNQVAPLEHINCFRRKSIEKLADLAEMEVVQVPFRIQYKYQTDWTGPKKIIKNILRPLQKNLLKKDNNVFLKPKLT